MRRKNSRTPIPLELESKELTTKTWPDFVKLFEKHGGVWGGCWCLFFHLTGSWAKRTGAQNKRDKKALVKAGKTHGVLVYHEGEPVGWCQFGPRDELPRIDAMKNYRPVDKENFWRITCFFVDTDHRHRGVAKEALRSALAAMKSRGVRTVEAYPVDTRNRRYPSPVLYKGSLRLFEEFSFEKVAKLEKDRYIVRKKL